MWRRVAIMCGPAAHAANFFRPKPVLSAVNAFLRTALAPSYIKLLIKLRLRAELPSRLANPSLRPKEREGLALSLIHISEPTRPY